MAVQIFRDNLGKRSVNRAQVWNSLKQGSPIAGPWPDTGPWPIGNRAAKALGELEKLHLRKWCTRWNHSRHRHCYQSTGPERSGGTALKNCSCHEILGRNTAALKSGFLLTPICSQNIFLESKHYTLCNYICFCMCEWVRQRNISPIYQPPTKIKEICVSKHLCNWNNSWSMSLWQIWWYTNIIDINQSKFMYDPRADI